MCGNCCSGPPGYVWLDDREIEDIAGHLQLSRDDFLSQYARKISGHWSLTETPSPHGRDCIFLKRLPDGRAICGIYPVRPMQCRTWPFWPELLESPESFAQAAETCPGIRAGLEGQGEHYDLVQIRVRMNATD